MDIIRYVAMAFVYGIFTLLIVCVLYTPVTEITETWDMSLLARECVEALNLLARECVELLNLLKGEFFDALNLLLSNNWLASIHPKKCV